MMWFYTLMITLILVLIWLTRVRDAAVIERFIVPPGTKLPGGMEVPDVDLSALPEPHTLFKKARELLDKYDKPEIWNHAAQVMDKDPGQLARMQLGIVNGL